MYVVHKLHCNCPDNEQDLRTASADWPMHGFSAHFQNSHARITFQKSFVFTCPQNQAFYRWITIENAPFSCFKSLIWKSFAFTKGNIRLLNQERFRITFWNGFRNVIHSFVNRPCVSRASPFLYAWLMVNRFPLSIDMSFPDHFHHSMDDIVRPWSQPIKYTCGQLTYKYKEPNSLILTSGCYRSFYHHLPIRASKVQI